MDLCKVDEFRIQSCEGKLRTLPEFQKKLNALNSAIMQMKGLEGDIRETKLFIERQLPGLIHLQLCEGLNSVAGNQLAELKEFEKRKLEELFYHDKDNAGKDAEIGKLRKRIQWIIGIMKGDELGAAPFVFKRNRDYWPGMKKDLVEVYGEDKLAFFRGRDSNYHKYVEVHEGLFNDKLKKFAYDEMYKMKDDMMGHVQKLLGKGGGRGGRMLKHGSTLKTPKHQNTFSRMDVKEKMEDRNQRVEKVENNVPR